ncbi:MAG: ribosomal protein S18-alanine N-acetyltransferase [Eubacterium sp.]
MKIEKFALQYLDDVANIEKICFAHPWSRQDLKNQLDLDTSHFLVAVENCSAVGYMGLQVFTGEGYVTNVAVLPQYRQRGIAKALIDEALKNDMRFITLEVRESNTPAIKLYEKAGFKNVGTRPNFYTDPIEDAIIMTKNVED